MRAIAVLPGKAGSIHLGTLEKPSIQDIPDGCGVLVQVLRVGVDGTDKASPPTGGSRPRRDPEVDFRSLS